MKYRCVIFYKFIVLFVLLFAGSAFAQVQERSISGVVVGVDGEPLIGATISLKGTSKGTITDFDGNFKIVIPDEKAVLVVAYIGYKSQEVRVGKKDQFRIVLEEDATMLQEMVVVGYGAQRKETVTGSIATVNTKDLARTTATTTGSALVGKVPGVTFRQVNGQPGQSMRMEIRNLGTPLFIIDGVMKDEGTFNNLDVNDIESISILKDGAAAIYGVKAANGVVLVKTKRGELNEKPTVSLNAYYGWQNWTRYPEFSNAYDYQRANAEALVNTKGPNNSDVISRDVLDKWRTGYYNPQTGEDYRGFDWYDFAVRKNAPQHYVNLSSSGGSDRTNYYLSVSHLTQDASFEDFQFNRSNFQLNMDTHINDYIKVGAAMNGRIETRLSPAVGTSYDNDFWNMRWGLNRNRPSERPYANDNPNYIAATDYLLTNHAYGRRDIIGPRDNVWRVFQGNWDVEVKTPIKGLKLNAMYSLYVANNQEEASRKKVLMYRYDAATGTYLDRDSEGNEFSTGSATLNKLQKTVWENMYRFSIDYDRKFGDHGISAIFVAEATERMTKTLRVGNNSIPNNYQDYFGTQDDNNEIMEDSFSEVPTAGFIGRLNYSYKDKYLLELAGRYDGSYKFPVDKRWGFFPSVSAAWRISEENFYTNGSVNNWLTNLKLRVSYGEMGDENVGIGDFDYLSGYNLTGAAAIISNNPFNSNSTSTVLIVNQRGLPVTNITWIKTSMSNVGLDLGFFNNKLNLEIDGFYRKRSGLTAKRSDLVIPSETGFELPAENLNSDMHMGIDGFVKWNGNVRDFNYYVGGNLTFARKKDGNSYGQRFANSWDEYRNSTHQRWAYVNWGYEVIGRFQTQEEADAYPVIMNNENGSDRNVKLMPGDLIYKDQNGDGIINDYDRRPIGYAEGGLPYFTFGLNFGFQWKGIDLSLDFAGAAMQSFQQDYETKWPFQADGNTFEYMVNDRWHHEDPLDPSSPWIAGAYPALRKTPTDAWHIYCSNSTYWLTNVSYFRLRNLEVGYTLPVQWTKKVLINQLRFYFLGTNLFSIDNLRRLGLDPENNDTNGLGYPNNRVLTVGINVTF